MTLLVEETNQTHKVNWTPWEILVTLVFDCLCGFGGVGKNGWRHKNGNSRYESSELADRCILQDFGANFFVTTALFGESAIWVGNSAIRVG